MDDRWACQQLQCLLTHSLSSSTRLLISTACCRVVKYHILDCSQQTIKPQPCPLTHSLRGKRVFFRWCLWCSRKFLLRCLEWEKKKRKHIVHICVLCIVFPLIFTGALFTGWNIMLPHSVCVCLLSGLHYSNGWKYSTVSRSYKTQPDILGNTGSQLNKDVIWSCKVNTVDNVLWVLQCQAKRYHNNTINTKYKH